MTTINGEWITNFLSTLRKLELLQPSGQVMFRPGWPDVDELSMKLAFVHLKMRNKNGKIET